MLKEYPEYKETPAIWIDKIPSSWKSKKVRELYTERREKVSDKDYEPLSVCKAGIVPQLEDAVKTDNGDNRRLVKKGDFVINSRSDRKGSSGVSQYDGSVSLICITLKPITNENQFFMHYLLRSVPFTEEYYRNGHGLVADLWTTRYDEMQNIFLPIPPISEQNAIVKYLDFKTKQIDEFVSAKEKEIAKLEELRCTLINTAVSRGIDNKNFKPSGMDWLPVIPEKWESINPKGLFALRKQKALKTDRQLTASQHHGVIFQEDYMAITGNRVVVVMKDFDILKHVEAGDFVISMRSFQGGIEYSENSGSISSAYVMLKPNPKFVYPKYFKWLFKSNLYITALQGTSDLVRDGQALRYANFVKVRLIKVPIEEQKAIADYLDKKTFEIDTLISSIQKQITLVKELRTKLIADVVTGKIDVRGAI